MLSRSRRQDVRYLYSLSFYRLVRLVAATFRFLVGVLLPLAKVASGYPCPGRFDAKLRSADCCREHLRTNCLVKASYSGKFGERFNGKTAPLTDAAPRAGIATQRPFHKDPGGDIDFFTDEGTATLKDLDDDPELEAVHWAPECRFMSRARGRHIPVRSDGTVPGPQPVRNERHVYGFS